NGQGEVAANHARRIQPASVVHQGRGTIRQLFSPVAVNPHLIIATATTAIMVGLSFAAQSGSTYRFSFLFLLPMVWGVYALRRKLFLHPVHYTLLCSALLLHNLGVFGFYRR